ncbi:MAG TPA: prolyl oligopeptidase family serine peptidase [Caulobacterales bacterium]|nr:prolyl oligopeptidase family serine peptidase [Caulobacterales bacterium]
MRLTVFAAALAAFALGSCSTTSQMTHAETPAAATPAAADPYLWLEDVDGQRALDWVRAQNARSLPVLQNDPRFARLHADALAIANSHDRLALGSIREGHLYNFWQDETHVRGLWRRSPLADYARGAPRWETLLDVDALATAENANWVFKGVDCLPRSTRCMVELSNGGKDAAVWREYDIATKTFVANGFSTPEAKASLEWEDVDTLLVATDWGAENGAPTVTESGYPMIVKRWRRGTPLASATEVLRGKHTDVGVGVGAVQDVDGSRTLFASNATTFFESEQFLLTPTSAQRVNIPAKANIAGLFKGQLLISLDEAWGDKPQGALISLPLQQAAAASPTTTLLFAPGPRESIESVEVTHDAVLVAGYQNVRGRVLRFAFDGHGWSRSDVALPANGAVGFAGASPTESLAFAVFEDFLTPSTLYALDNRATTARAVKSLPAMFDASPYVTEQFEATSRDGTRVPYFVVHRRDMPLNGENPTLLYAYGGFQLSMLPAYSPNVGKLWLDNGGTYVLANIRGGGEFGPAWHEAGLKTHRQVIYDDFYAVEQDLVSRRITSPRRLGIMGGSNGGLLMGVMIEQHPEMIHAAVVQVPLLDMLRYDQLLAGASWVDEYGSPNVPEERAFLETISPYQNLRRRDDFPLIYIETSTKDDRVHPGHARKFAARMEELGMPFLYYENIDGGHSAAANLNEAARRRALEYTYLMQRLMD